MRKINVFITFSLALILIGILTACGGPKETKLTVNLKDMAFDPPDVTMPAGAKVSLTLNNQGTLDHEWVIMKKGTKATVPFDSDDEGNIYWKAELEKGKSGTFEFTAPTETGEYQLVCGTPGHIQGGMVGKLTVQ